jgi:hypothetical protein
MMTLDEAILHCKEKEEECSACGQEHKQLREWLEEYKTLTTVEKFINEHKQVELEHRQRPYFSHISELSIQRIIENCIIFDGYKVCILVTVNDRKLDYWLNTYDTISVECLRHSKEGDRYKERKFKNGSKIIIMNENAKNTTIFHPYNALLYSWTIKSMDFYYDYPERLNLQPFKSQISIEESEYKLFEHEMIMANCYVTSKTIEIIFNNTNTVERANIINQLRSIRNLDRLQPHDSSEV